MRRRCLQFEEVQLNMIANDPSFSYSTSIATSLRSPVTPSDPELLEPSCVEVTTTSSDKQLAYSQPVTSMLPPQNGGNSPLAVAKSSGIGLHLNSIIKAVPIGFSSNASLELGEKDYSRGRRMSGSIPSNLLEKVSAGAEDRRNENKAPIPMSSAASHSSCGMELSKDPLLLKPVELHETPCDKRKFNSECMDNLEEFNQPSPKRRLPFMLFLTIVTSWCFSFNACFFFLFSYLDICLFVSLFWGIIWL